MKPFKSVLKSEGVRRVLCLLGSWYIRFVFATGRWKIVGDAVPRRFWNEGTPFILAFWHGRLLMMPYCWPRKTPIHMLISQHRDGRIIADTVSHFGIDTISGSSTRGGAAALRAMLRRLAGGECVGITPDGPHGPRMRASDGIVNVARLSGAPVIPATYAVNRRKLLGSWDRFIVALPFARGVVLWGEPIQVARDQEAEPARQRIEDALTALCDQADAMVGAAPVEAAAP